MARSQRALAHLPTRPHRNPMNSHLRARARLPRALGHDRGARLASGIMAHWLIKSEPDVFGYADLVRVGTEGWDGIRNYQSRNFMREMKKGDTAIFYHS